MTLLLNINICVRCAVGRVSLQKLVTLSSLAAMHCRLLVTAVVEAVVVLVVALVVVLEMAAAVVVSAPLHSQQLLGTPSNKRQVLQFHQIHLQVELECLPVV